jgi:hypothetical protein
MPTNRPAAAPVTTTAAVVQRSDARPGLVSQDELREYDRLRRQRDQLTDELRKRRGRLIDRLIDGLPVEPGPHGSKLRQCLVQVLWSKQFDEALAAADRGAQVDEQLGRVAPPPGSTSR